MYNVFEIQYIENLYLTLSIYFVHIALYNFNSL